MEASMKKYFLFAIGILMTASFAWADDPDLQGCVTGIDYIKNVVQVRNELKNSIGNRDYRVLVKQGMINNYKRNDKLKIWLMEDHKEAAMIERISR